MLCCPLYRHLPDDKSGAYDPLFSLFDTYDRSGNIDNPVVHLYLLHHSPGSCMIRHANEINLAKIAQVFIILVMIITIINICFIKLPKLWASADQTGPDLYSRIISSEDGAVMLDNGSMGSFQPDRIPLLLCDLVPSLLFIWVLIASFRLCRSLKDNHFTDQTIQDAGALSHLCVRVLCITAVLEVVRNILQLLMLPSLSDTTFTVSLPIIEILLTVTAFILAKKFETAHTLEEENEAFI